MKEVLVSGIRISARSTAAGLEKRLRGKIAGLLELSPRELGKIRITGKSIDARGREPVLLFKAAVEVPDDVPLKPWEMPEAAVPVFPENISLKNPLVVGTGPAGIFCGLALAMAGTEPLILDRGPCVEDRCAGIEDFLSSRQLDENCNLLIGEGGAGTFSDGKLYTGTHDKMARFVLQTFVEAGAPQEILYLARPHIGTDFLKVAASGLRRKIISLGGSFKFNTQVTDIVVQNGKCSGVVCADGSTISAPAVVVACGLGGRELARNLMKKVDFELKPFQLGCRIEHPQEFIDFRQYHGARPELLGAAEYHLVSRPGGTILPVSSFCMCPGGTVVNASAWQNACATNGMSDFARDGEFANACLISTLSPDFSGSVEKAFELIEEIERSSFLLGGKNYTFPAQDAAGFLRNEVILRNRKTSCHTGIIPGEVRSLLPAPTVSALSSALKFFDRQLPGFIKNGKFIGVEPCVSSPLRFTRKENGFSSIDNLILSGEGAGASGGIISAACDGIRAAKALLPVTQA
ncbi:MAG: hypothetical protein IKC05_00135 [Lentisphaeria bacterium]|nr:hypothetical protein [Lentisphaeria bacterium]